ncbi:hypothetical protein KI440_03990 [Candidatus Saccharibacteria bacterium TM7i]|nr:hypothetical protein KI440_03990 [Candidatus Saccharibacteria bacterium TM7i]
MNQSPADYLDKIAPQAPKRQLFQLNLRNVIFLAIGIVILVIIMVVIANAIGGGKNTPWQQLSLRLTNTEKVTSAAGSSIKNSQLRSLNSEVKIYLTNTQRDLATPFKTVGVTPKKIPASITKSEATRDTEMTTRLETARFNAKYDSAYAREMSYQLSGILALYQQLHSQSGPNTKKTLETAYNNLLPTQKAIAEFSASNE